MPISRKASKICFKFSLAISFPMVKIAEWFKPKPQKPKGKLKQFIETIDMMLSGNPHIQQPKTARTNRKPETYSSENLEETEEELDQFDKESEEFDLESIEEEYIT